MALTASKRWQLGLCEFAQGRYGVAAAHFEASTLLFERLGELVNAASTRELLAETLEFGGDTAAAWEHRPATLRVLAENDGRLHSALAHIAMVAIDRGEWDVATAFLKLEAAQGGRVHNPQLVAHAWVRTAVLHARSRNAGAAAVALRQAAAQTALIADASLRKRVEIDLGYAEAIVASGRSAIAALPLLTQAIAFHRNEGRRMYVPALLLERAKARRALNDQAGEWVDLEEAVRELETQRGAGEALTAADMDLNIASEAFSLAAERLLGAGSKAAAFEMTERAATFALYGAPPPPVATEVMASLPDSTVLIAYASLPTRVVVFVVDRQGIRAVPLTMTQEVLRRDVRRFTAAVASDAGSVIVRREAASAHEQLIAPVGDALSKARTVVVVPGPLGSVPFAALYDSAAGRYLIESHSIVIAPSAGTYIRSRGASRGRGEGVLVVANPAYESRDSLPETREEAREIRKLYRDVQTLSGGGATVAAFLAGVQNAAIVHIGVHGVGGGGRSSTTALAFAEAGADHGLLDSRTIARLHLRSTRVAVLAACSSADGGGPRERTISVARAFLAAGVPSVIGSLWSLPDHEGAVLMIAFHRALAAGMTPADALREAQLSALRSSDPSVSRAVVWAGLQNFGN